VLRFGVLKPNKVGVKKKRMLTLLLKQRVIRSFNRKKDFKDIHFESIIKFEKLYDDVSRLHMYLKKRDDPVILLFTDTGMHTLHVYCLCCFNARLIHLMYSMK
jgi:hypothetical protein